MFGLVRAKQGKKKGSGGFFSFHHHLFKTAIGLAGWIPDEDVPPFCALPGSRSNI